MNDITKQWDGLVHLFEFLRRYWEGNYEIGQGVHSKRERFTSYRVFAYFLSALHMPLFCAVVVHDN